MEKDNIIPYVEFELDCVQNLYATILKSNGYDLKYFGSMWPWEFIWDSEGQEKWKPLKLMSSKCISREKIKDIYDLNIIYRYLETTKELILELDDYIKTYKAVIVNIDQFHAHYHYPYIYHKQHGIHATMITGIDSKSGDYYCVSAVPEYKGMFSRKELCDGIESSFTKWISIVEIPSCSKKVDDFKVYSEFLAVLEEIYKSYSEADYKTEKYYTKDIIKFLEKLLMFEDEVELKKELELICDGTWGWSVHKKGPWLKRYLSTDSFFKNNIKIEAALSLIDEICSEWMIAFRFLFKASQSKEVKKLINKSIYKLREIMVKECNLLEMLIK